MRVSTTQEARFADSLIATTKLDIVNNFIDWQALMPYLQDIEGDRFLSLFKVLLVQPWFNISDRVAAPPPPLRVSLPANH